MPIEAVCERYGTQINEEKAAESFGLSEETAAKYLERDGPNMMTPPKEIPPWRKYLGYVTSLFNLLLIVSGILCEILYGIDTTQTVNVCSYSLELGLKDLYLLIVVLGYHSDRCGVCQRRY